MEVMYLRKVIIDFRQRLRINGVEKTVEEWLCLGNTDGPYFMVPQGSGKMMMDLDGTVGIWPPPNPKESLLEALKKRKVMTVEKWFSYLGLEQAGMTIKHVK